MTGHPDFERCVRVYENQLEQYIPFIVSMFLTAVFVNGNLAGKWFLQPSLEWHKLLLAPLMYSVKEPHKGILLTFCAYCF